MADLLICSQCKGDFKDPRALPCLHILCLRCLVELADCAYEEDAITCPICQEFHPLTSKGVFGFPTEFPNQELPEDDQRKRTEISEDDLLQDNILRLSRIFFVWRRIVMGRFCV